MLSSRTTFLAFRAVVAIFLETTAGYFLVAVSFIAIVLSVFLSYAAINVTSLMWLLAGLTILIAIWSVFFALTVYAVVFRVLPRKLKRSEKRFIKSYVRFLRKRMAIEKTPLMPFVWRLFVDELLGKNESAQKTKIEKEVNESLRLSEGFKTIKNFFSS